LNLEKADRPRTLLAPWPAAGAVARTILDVWPEHAAHPHAGGRPFVNGPLNSPSPDHACPLSRRDQARGLVKAAGSRLEAPRLFAALGAKRERARANRVSLPAGMIAVPA
jgi:hypothetical protein